MFRSEVDIGPALSDLNTSFEAQTWMGTDAEQTSGMLVMKKSFECIGKLRILGVARFNAVAIIRAVLELKWPKGAIVGNGPIDGTNGRAGHAETGAPWGRRAAVLNHALLLPNVKMAVEKTEAEYVLHVVLDEEVPDLLDQAVAISGVELPATIPKIG